MKECDNYNDTLEKMLRKYYTMMKTNDTTHVTFKHQIHGYVQAGIVMGLLKSDQVNQVVERIHFEVFSMAISERRKISEYAAPKRKTNGDEDYIIPTFLRKGFSGNVHCIKEPRPI